MSIAGGNPHAWGVRATQIRSMISDDLSTLSGNILCLSLTTIPVPQTSGKFSSLPMPLHPPHSSQQKTLPPTSLQKLRTSGGMSFTYKAPIPQLHMPFYALSGREPLSIKANSSSEFDSCLHRNVIHWLASFSWTYPLGHSPPASNILKQNKMNKENLLPSYARSSSFHPPAFISFNSQVSLKIFFEILYF